MNTPPLVCATVTGTTMAELRARRDAVRGADLVEVRLDGAIDPDVDAALSGRRVPTIVTCRHRDHGGWFAGSEAERRSLLLTALERGADFVDLEWGMGFDEVIRRRGGQNIVLSMHEFRGVPADLEARTAAMLALGPQVVKVAVAVSRLAECGRLRDLARRHPDGRLVLIGMGDAGAVTRICPAHVGSRWTYAGDGVAAGQMTIGQLEREFRFRRIRADTTLYGICGQPIGHSVSPAMHNAGFESLGINAAYVPLAAADLDDLFAGAASLDVAGASVTRPFKVGVMPYLAGVEAEAAQIGAVNTLVRDRDGWRGFNTDVEGFRAGLGALDLTGWRVAVLGTGGGARAAVHALRRWRCATTLFGRDALRARAVASSLGVTGAGRPVPAGSWDLLVNTTPVGMVPGGDESAFPEGRYDGRVVYDLVYNPAVTRLLRDAAERGCRTIGGLDMLVEQARRQAAIWTGHLPEADLLREAARWKLSTRSDRS